MVEPDGLFEFGLLIAEMRADRARDRGEGFLESRKVSLLWGIQQGPGLRPYLPSAAHAYLDPALAVLRRTHPQVKIVLHDLFPGEQIALLRRGEIDVALVGQEGRTAEREFYTRKLAALSLVVILPTDHPLAARPSVRLAELRGERFVRTLEEHLPGRDRWVTQLCRAAGFRAKFGSVADHLSHALSLVVSEGLACLTPALPRGYPTGGVTMVSLAEPTARWDMLVVWQRGQTAGALRALLDALVDPVARKRPL